MEDRPTKKLVVIHAIPSVFAMISIGFLEYTALKQGIDGTMFALSVGLIAGLGGYKAKDIAETIKSLFK